MSQALYRTWRPALWEEVVGQDPIVQTLKNAIAADRVGHAYLFGGPKGTGKTTSARLLAKAVNCLDPDITHRPCNHCANCLAVNEGRFLDLIEIDAASNTSVDDVRDLRDKINFSPSQGRFKVYIVDEVHMLSTSAFNALLKTLEEPPAHVIFILATTEIHKIPATVLSRCQRFEFRRLPVPIIVGKLKDLCSKENIGIDDDALNLIARQATGSMRDAISLVDQLSSMNKTITLALAQDILGTATSQAVIDLVTAILARSDADGLLLIHQALDSGADPRQFARQVVDYLRNLLVIKMKAGKDLDLLPEIRSQMCAQAEQFETPRLIAIINAFSGAATDLKANWHPGLGLELAYAASISTDAQSEKAVPFRLNENASKSTRPKAVSPAYEKPAPVVQSSPLNAGPVAPSQTNPVASSKTETREPIPAGTELTMDLVKEHWEEIKRALKADDPVAAALLSSAKLTGLRDGVLSLDFTSDLLRDRMMEEKNLRFLRKILLRLLGQDLLVTCTVGQRNLSPDDPADGIVPNGLVDTALRELHGRIAKKEKKTKAEE